MKQKRNDRIWDVDRGMLFLKVFHEVFLNDELFPINPLLN